MNCKNCTTETHSNFCPNCGKQVIVQRIDGQYILNEIRGVLNFERGFLFTIKGLVTNPGQNVRNYLVENRNRLVKPILFIFLTSLIYSICINVFQFEDGYAGYHNADENTTSKLFKWVQGNYGYSNLMIGIFIAFYLKLFFRKHKYNIFEILILLCFVMGLGMFVLSIFGVIEGLTQQKLLQFGSLITFIYMTWAIGQFFDSKKIFSYVKALFAYILGMMTFGFLLIVIGNVLDKFM